MASHSSTLAWRIPVDGGAWRAAVRGVTKSRTRLRTERLSRAQQDFWFLEEPPAKQEGTTFLRLMTAPNTVLSVCLSLVFPPSATFFFLLEKFNKKKLFLAVRGLHGRTGFFLVATSKGGSCSLVVVYGLLIAIASLAAEHRL